LDGGEFFGGIDNREAGTAADRFLAGLFVAEATGGGVEWIDLLAIGNAIGIGIGVNGIGIESEVLYIEEAVAITIRSGTGTEAIGAQLGSAGGGFLEGRDEPTFRVGIQRQRLQLRNIAAKYGGRNGCSNNRSIAIERVV